MKLAFYSAAIAAAVIFAPSARAQAPWPVIYQASGVTVALDVNEAKKNPDGSYITRTRWDYAEPRKLESKKPYTQMTEVALVKCTPVRVKRLTETFYAEGGAVVREGTMPSPGEVQYMTWDRPKVRSDGAKAFSNSVTALFMVAPSGGGTLPAAAFTCPSTGAYLPSAYAGVTLTVAASDAGGVTKIEFFRPGDTTPFSTSTPAVGAPTTYSATSTAVTLPTVAGDTVVRYRARAWNTSALYSEIPLDLHVVPMVDVATATATDIAVVRTGTVTLDTPKTFAGLVILKGAALTHSATLAVGAEKSLNLTVNGPTYVECGGAIDTTGAVSSNYGGTLTIDIAVGTGAQVKFTNLSGAGAFTYLGNGRAVYQWVGADMGIVSLMVKDGLAECVNIRVRAVSGRPRAGRADSRRRLGHGCGCSGGTGRPRPRRRSRCRPGGAATC